MKYLIIFLVICFTYLYGCGNDSTTNSGGPGNGETVIFSMDSLSIYLNSSIQANDSDIVITNAPNIKITFNCSTNADSISTLALYRIVVGDSNNVYKDTTNDKISKLNSNQEIIINGSNSLNLKIYIQMSSGNSTPGYIKLSNIKVNKL